MTHRALATLRHALRPGVGMIAVAILTACGGGPSEAPAPTSIDRETFIATYVDLRTAAVRGVEHGITDAERTRILTQHGVTEDDLLSFASANGENVDYMRQVWDEVERRLDALRLKPDSAA